jgi:glycosyltransferase involved in cell wall biosynthesis
MYDQDWMMQQPEAAPKVSPVIPEPRLAVVIPALNEEQAIVRVLQAIPKSITRLVVVVDNGSTDHTAGRARSQGAMVLREPRRGYGTACLAGIDALPEEIEIVVFLDADYSDHPEEMEILVAPILKNEADFVLGSRMMRATSRSVLTPQQRFGNWLATTLIRLLFGHRYTDLGPFRAIRKDALDSLEMSDRGYGWTVEMQIKAIRTGLRILEVPVHYRPRLGKSKISGTLKGTLLAGSKILYTVFRFAAADWRDA